MHGNNRFRNAYLPCISDFLVIDLIRPACFNQQSVAACSNNISVENLKTQHAKMSFRWIFPVLRALQHALLSTLCNRDVNGMNSVRIDFPKNFSLL